MVFRFLIVMLAFSMTPSFAADATGEGSLLMPNEMKGAEIVNKVGAQLPLHLVFTRHDGEKVTLGSMLAQSEGSSFIALNYSDCPMLCSLVMNGLAAGYGGLDYDIQQKSQVLSISIDPNETVKTALERRQKYLKQLGLEKGWDFFVGEKEATQQLADSLGFGFRYDPKSGEFAHGAGIFAVTKDGRLSQTLYGAMFAPQDLRFALVEASEGKLGSLLERIVLTCFHYNPDKHKYGVYIFGMMRASAFGFLLLLVLALLYYWRIEKRKSDQP